MVVGPLFGTCFFLQRLILATGGSKLADLEAKTCALAQECVEGSVNFGAAKTLITSKCCNSELCNIQSAPGILHPVCIVLHCSVFF